MGKGKNSAAANSDAAAEERGQRRVLFSTMDGLGSTESSTGSTHKRVPREAAAEKESCSGV